jgi:predicted dehydrogenase
MPRLHIGLIGAGFIGVAHANAIETILSEKLVLADFVSVCDTNEEKAKAIAESFGAHDSCSDPLALIDSGKIDTVFICTPTKFHPELVEASAKRGLNIFCEKPLARSLAEARAMLSVVMQAGAKNQVGLVLRFSPVYHAIKQFISNPGLGRPMAAMFRDDQYFPIQGIYGSTWRKDADVAGSGALLEHSIHDVDILRWLLGDIASIRGTIKNFAGHRGVEDLAAAHLHFQNGCVGQLLSAWHNIMRRESNRYMEIFFENGFISSADDFIGPIAYQMGDKDLIVLSAEEVLRRYLDAAGLTDARYNSLHSGQGLEDYHFLRALEAGIKPDPDFDVAIKAHEIVEAVYRSAQSGSEVRLPL